MHDWLKLYHQMPYPLRVVGASLHGYYLRWWRYGGNTERLVDEALERDCWTREDWKNWQEERLAFVLHRAATQVPYYRGQWVERRRKGDRASWELLENWPTLLKHDVRAAPQAFIASDCKAEQMRLIPTSGTTGTPLKLFFQRETLQRRYALFEARIRRWHGVSVKQRWAIMGGQLVVPFEQREPPYWVYNAGLKQLYLSTHHLSSDTASAYVEALRRYKPTHIIGYPSSMHVLAQAMLQQSLVPPDIEVMFSNAETLLPQQRAHIEDAFQCSTFNTYGMAESVVMGSECQHRAMHLWPEIGCLEVLQDDSDIPARKNEVGRFVATSLLNADMPLIRYEVGDRGRAGGFVDSCPCGRQLPILHDLEGRMNDLVRTPDGRKIFWLNPVFYKLPLVESQIVQESEHELRVLIVPTPEFDGAHEDAIRQRLKDRLGNMTIVIDRVDHIERTENGKLQAIVSRV